MSTRTREPDLDAEQEVDLGRYWRAIATRWWLPLGGLVAGAIVGYLISLGGSQVWRASATVYLGTPYSVISSVQLVSIQTNPATVNAIVHSDEAIQTAAAAAGVKPGAIRGGISTKGLSAGVASTTAQKTSANPLVRITVQTSAPRKARIAANSLANQVVAKLAPYADSKIAVLQKRIAADQADLDAVRRLTGRSGDATLQAVLSIQATQVYQDQLTALQLLSQAQQVERPSILSNAVPVKETARSRRNSTVVGAFLGLLLGLIAALVWEPLVVRRRS